MNAWPLHSFIIHPGIHFPVGVLHVSFQFSQKKSSPPGDFRIHSAKSAPAKVNNSAKVLAVKFVLCLSSSSPQGIISWKKYLKKKCHTWSKKMIYQRFSATKNKSLGFTNKDKVQQDLTIETQLFKPLNAFDSWLCCVIVLELVLSWAKLHQQVNRQVKCLDLSMHGKKQKAPSP